MPVFAFGNLIMKSRLFTTLALSAFTTCAHAQTVEEIENPTYKAITSKIANAVCPDKPSAISLEEQKVAAEKCTLGLINRVHTISNDLSGYMKDLHAPIDSPEALAVFNGQSTLRQYCEIAFNEVTNATYDDVIAKVLAERKAIGNCLNAISVAGKGVNVNWQPGSNGIIAKKAGFEPK